MRDFLKGELKFTSNGTCNAEAPVYTNSREETSYSNQPSPSSTSGGHRGKKTFYVDSDMDSSAHTSPEHDQKEIYSQQQHQQQQQQHASRPKQAQQQSRTPIELTDISPSDDGSSHKRVERQSSRERLEAWVSQKTGSGRRSSQEWANNHGGSSRKWRFKTVGLFGGSDNEDCDKNQNRSGTKSAHDYANSDPHATHPTGRKFTI